MPNSWSVLRQTEWGAKLSLTTTPRLVRPHRTAEHGRGDGKRLTRIQCSGILRGSKSKPRQIISWHRAAPLPCPPAKAGRRNGAAASPELSQESTGALNRELAARTLRCRTFFLDRIARSGVR